MLVHKIVVFSDLVFDVLIDHLLSHQSFLHGVLRVLSIALIVSVHFSECFDSFVLLLFVQFGITCNFNLLFDLQVVFFENVVSNQELSSVLLVELSVTRDGCEYRNNKITPSVVGKIRDTPCIFDNQKK